MSDSDIDKLIIQFKNHVSYSNAGTANSYMPFIRDFLKVFLKTPPLQATAMDFTDWFKHLEDDKHYSKRTVKVGASALKRFYKALGHPEIASMIPLPNIGEVTEAKWLGEDAMFKLIGKVTVLCTAYDLALRIGEVGLLKAETFNHQTGVIQVIREKHKGRPNKYQLTLSPWCREILSNYLARNQIKHGQIFQNSVMTFNTIFRRRRQLAGLDSGYKFHCLRHSRLTHIAIHELETKGTVDIVSLAKFAGHSNVNITLNYIHLASTYLSYKNPAFKLSQTVPTDAAGYLAK